MDALLTALVKQALQAGNAVRDRCGYAFSRPGSAGVGSAATSGCPSAGPPHRDRWWAAISVALKGEEVGEAVLPAARVQRGIGG